MRIDLYTKAILTVIAAFLMVLVLRPMFEPSSVRADEGAWTNTQLAVGPTGPWVLLTGTSGQAFLYSYDIESGRAPRVWTSVNPRDPWHNQR